MNQTMRKASSGVSGGPIFSKSSATRLGSYPATNGREDDDNYAVDFVDTVTFSHEIFGRLGGYFSPA